jgi:excisionase family DNA binding protein
MTESTGGAAGQWVTVPQIAKELGIPRSRCYELIAKGQLPAVRVGERSLRVHRGQLERYLLEQRPASRVNATEDE